MKKNDVQTTLQERGKTHGSWEDNAKIAQDLKAKFREIKQYENLTFVEKEALDYIAQKISRVISKGGGFVDDWRDIAGYATLTMEWLQTEAAEGATDVKVVRLVNCGKDGWFDENTIEGG